MYRPLVILLLTALALSGCENKPQPEKPQPPLPEETDCSLLDIEALDFSKDRIHIVNNPSGKPVALVTLEYLGVTLGKQAVLVYTRTSDNKWKTDSIFVAKVTLVERGMSFVEPDECCSGGFLKFYNADAAYFYQDISEAVQEPAQAVFIKESEDGSTYIKRTSNTQAISRCTPMRLMLGGYSYPLVKIAGSIWTGENIRTSSYPDGSIIPSASSWSAHSPNMGWSSNQVSGALYNAYAAERLVPEGWRLPSGGPGGDWNALDNFSGGASALKIKGTNVTGFSIIPFGRISSSGVRTESENDDHIFWTSTSESDTKSIIAKVFYKTAGDNIQYQSSVDKRNGFGVRLVKTF